MEKKENQIKENGIVESPLILWSPLSIFDLFPIIQPQPCEILYYFFHIDPIPLACMNHFECSQNNLCLTLPTQLQLANYTLQAPVSTLSDRSQNNITQQS